MPGSHATLSPSAAKRWVSCPPSARLNAKYLERFGEKSSEFAEEGTKAHALSELKLRRENGEINEFNYNEQRKSLGDIPHEMDRFTDVYVDTVLEEFYMAKKNNPNTKLFVEQKLNMSRWIPQCFGTSDAVIVSDSVLIVIDLKYGKGVPVEAEGNYQARIYALGAVEQFSVFYASEFKDDSQFTFQHVKEIICQPRLDSITSEQMKVSELLEWGEWLRPYAELAWQGLGEFSCGEHCRFCNVRALCRTRLNHLLDLAQQGFESPEVLTDEMLVDILPYLDDVQDYCKDVKEYARSLALNGTPIRGYKIVRGKRPSRVWKNENDVLDQLCRAGYTEEQYCVPQKLKSVAEMEKTLGKQAFSALLGSLTFQGEGALTLVPETDKREAFSSALLAFSDLAEPSETETNTNQN